MIELSQKERSFILNYRQATPKGQEFAAQKLREASAKAESERTRKNRSINNLIKG